MKKTILTLGLLTGLQVTTQAQSPYWMLNGNPTTGADAVNTGNNFLGTDGSNNTFMKFGVQGEQDIMIDNDNTKLYPTDLLGRRHGGHWVGIGRSFTPTNGPGSGVFVPRAHLHIDGGNNTPNFAFGNGFRPWFNTGTLYTENSDGMYVGLKNVGPDFSYAVINWSDNNIPNPGSTDFLSFNFTGGPNGLAPTVDGMEVARMTPNPEMGTLGVGNFQFINVAAEPVRRVEILDASPVTGSNENAPQLRLTYKYSAIRTQGIFSEFQTTSNGDLFFNTRVGSGTNDARSFGFHTFSPLNTVEISAQNVSPYSPSAAPGSSGLRFTSLTSANTTIPNGTNGVNNKKVLTVDGHGDVVLTDALSGGGGGGGADNGLSLSGPTAGRGHLGQDVGATGDPARLLNNREIPFYTNNIYFTGQDNWSQSSIYVGYPGNSTDRAKINVINTAINQNNNTAGVLGINRSFYNNPPTPGIYAAGVEGISDLLHTQVRMNNIGGKFLAEQWYPIGVKGSATNNNSTAASMGVMGEAYSPLGSNIGGFFRAIAGTITNVGIRAAATGGVSGTTGIEATAYGTGSSPAYAGMFMAGGGNNNFGVYAAISGFSGAGIDWAGYFNGDVYTSSSTYYTSDKNLKKDIQEIKNPLDKLMKLKPAYYSYDTEKGAQYGLHLQQGYSYGFMAQDVQSVFPELVKENVTVPVLDSNGVATMPVLNFKSVNYVGMIGILTGAIQELATKQREVTAQQLTIDSLKAVVAKQESVNRSVQEQLNNLATQISQSNVTGSKNSNSLSTEDISLSDQDKIVLDQNTPNPFAEQTTITYNLPQNITKAQIVFYNGTGQVIKTVDLRSRGKGKINVFASDLSSGLYHYALIVDDKTIDSKKMVKE